MKSEGYIEKIKSSKIAIIGLNKYFTVNNNQKQIIKDMNVNIKSGEFVCMLGPSGCGKSSVLNLISGLDVDYDGKIFIEGKLLDSENPSEQTKNMVYLFQKPRLLPWLTVEKNIYFALQCAKIPKEKWSDITQKYLDMVNLGSTRKQYIHELSGGMQHRVAIARAFSVNPDILLMDEPFSALDELTARNLRENLLSMWRENKKTVIFVTHNATEATFLSDRILMFKANPGEIMEDKTISISRPRNYESEEFFSANQEVVSKFLEIIGEK